MQRRLRNTLAIAIAGGALIIGAGTAAAATPADEVTSNAPQVDSSLSKIENPADNINTDVNSDAVPGEVSKPAQQQVKSSTNQVESSADRLDKAAPKAPEAPATPDLEGAAKNNPVKDAAKNNPVQDAAKNAPVQAPEVAHLQK